MICCYTFVPRSANTRDAEEAAMALDLRLQTESDLSYAKMIRYRLAGKAASVCEDRYFIAMDGSQCISRIWYGWGRHACAVGNFGNFMTAEEYQGRGIGSMVFRELQKSVEKSSDLPLGLFCSCSQMHLVKMYGRLGFRPAIAGTDRGALYCPLGGSPGSFDEFCDMYSTESDSLHFAPGTVEYRHEVDCLLNFALRTCSEALGLASFRNYEGAFLALEEDPALGKLERIATQEDKTVGWAFTPSGSDQREIQLHPRYRNMPIEERLLK